MGKIAINGFGRIGRIAFRVLYERGLHTQLVAVNDLTDAPTLAHLLEYDSNYGRLKGTVKSHLYEDKPPYSGALIVDGHAFYTISEKDPANLPWKALDVDLVIESTGRFTTSDGMQKHLQAGAKRVLLSAPADGVLTAVRGVNDSALTADSTLVANASCTTNCITPVAAVIHATFGVEKAMMTTIHSYTADQELQDAPHKDLRRARAAAINIVPTTTGATKAATKVIPELEGLFNGLAIRVPTPVGSLSDFTFVTKKPTTVEEVNKALQEASERAPYKGILETTTAPLVSRDIVGTTASSIVDCSLTQVVGGNLVKVIAWYDNEWGYTNRLIDQAVAMMSLKAPQAGAEPAGQPAEKNAATEPPKTEESPAKTDAAMPAEVPAQPVIVMPKPAPETAPAA